MLQKEYLPVNRRGDLFDLTEWVVSEINIAKKAMFYTSSFRSPSATIEEFEFYSQHVNLILSNVDMSQGWIQEF